ncbi:MAG: NAD(P)-dependent oxidoreductase [Gammaproteobacteria bacterium]|nr:NAD(P)-dependent oxidoreductase [Gammaproteobacteria bacterium]
MTSLKNKTIFITGASRGIGKAIALRAAKEGARIVIAAKTETPHPKLPGTIYTAAEEIKAAGGEALPCPVDIRSEEQVQKAVEKAVAQFGGIDILVNNASAISLTDTPNTEMKRYDLMHQVNVRGTFLCTKTCLPFLKKASNPHVLMLSPPLYLKARWFAPHLAYTMSKYGMSLCVLGMAEEFKKDGIAVNALWPRTTIKTAAILNIVGGERVASRSRIPDIVSDAAYWVLTQDSKTTTGQFFIDEVVLKKAGVRDFSQYKVDSTLPEEALMADFYIP